jgi:hypothetical protein
MLAQPRTLNPFAQERRRNWQYLLDVEFATNASAPLTSYDGEVGTLDVSDGSSVWSVTGGALTPGAAASGSGQPLFHSRHGWTWQGGLLYASKVNAPSVIGAGNLVNQMMLATSTGNSANSSSYGVRADRGIGLWRQYAPSGVVILGEAFAVDTDYDVAVVARPTAGFFAFINGKLVWVGTDVPSSAVNAAMTTGGITDAPPFSVAFARVRLLSVPFQTDYGIALLHTASVSGSDYTATADVIADLVVTAPASLAGAAGLRFRKSSDDYWQVNFDNLGRLRLQRYASGVAQGSAVNLANSVIGGSAAVTLRVIASGSHMDFYTLAGTTWTKRGSQQTDSVLSANTGVMPFADSSWVSGGGSVGQLDAYARTDAAYAGVDGS